MWALLLSALLVFTVVTPVFGATIEDDIEGITSEILRKEIQLERNYLQWRLVAGKDPKWRRARYFAIEEAGTALTMVSSLYGVVELGKNMGHPEDVRPPVLRKAYNIGTIGTILGGAGSGFELASNTYTFFKNRANHTDPESHRKQLFGRLDEIDALMKKRADMISSLGDSNPGFARMSNAETRVLKDFRDWCIFEYSDVYADVKSYQASNSFYYFLDIAAQTTAAVAYGMSNRSLKRPKIGGTISIVGMVSDSLFIVGGPASTVAYNLFYKFWSKRLAKQLKHRYDDPEDETKVAMEALSGLATTESGKTRVGIYKTWTGRYDDYITERTFELRHLSKVALQNNISGPLISANYLAADIMSCYSFYRLQERPNAANTLGVAGSIASMSASAISMAISAQMLIAEKLFERKLRKEGGLPEQLMAQRLKTLTDLEAMLPKSDRIY